MKKYLWVLAVFALSACDQGNSTSPSASNNNSTSISTGPSIVEVVKKFSLSLNPAEGTEIKVLEASSDNKYESGSTVRFTVDVKDESKELVAVKINERFVGAVSGNEYEAVMPNDNAVISTETRSLGDASIASVSDVVAEGLPTTPQEAHETLLGTIQAESKFLKSATYDSNYESSSGVTMNMQAEVGFNDVVKVSGRKLSYSGVTMAYFSGEEKGITDGHYYKISEETLTNSNSVKGELKTIVDDEKEVLNSWEIKEADAKVNASTAGFVSNLLARTFSKTSSESFITTQTTWCWTDVQVKTEVDASNKFYTLSLTANYSSYNRFVSLDVVIDGDNFVKSAVFAAKDYNSDDIDSETKLPFADATPKSVRGIEIHQERNYRHTTEKTDINQFVTDDYDVLLSYQLPGQTEVTVDPAKMEVENSAKLAYKVRQKDVKKFMFLPNLVGAKEEDGVIFDDGKAYLNKQGNITLLFDNGFGVIKEVAIKSIQPLPYSITTDLPSSIFSNESYDFHVTISPSAADQTATVTLKDGSECEATITKNDDGSFNIVATTNGNGTLVISSAIDQNVKKEVSFTVSTKPNPDNVYNFLTTTTLFGKVSSYGSHFINLNTDGTGEYICYEGENGKVIPFTWEFDRATLAINVTVDKTLKSKYYNFDRLFDATETSVKFSFIYSGVEKGPAILTALDAKLDFTATDLDLSKY